MHSDSRFDSIRFPKKSNRSIQPQLVGVCMQSLSTPNVCTLYAGIIHLVLFHNSVRIDGLPQLTRARVVNIVTVIHHHFNITVFLAYLSCLLLVASTIGLTVESYGTNRLESIFWRESNRIEIIYGESECTTSHSSAG